MPPKNSTVGSMSKRKSHPKSGSNKSPSKRIRGPVRAPSAMVRDPNYQCRVDIYDELRAKCAKDTAACKGILPDGTLLTYSDCEKYGATAADLLNNFPTDKEHNQRLKTMLKEGRNSGDESKKEWDLSAAKKCLTQMWYGSEEGKARLEACPAPKRSSRKPKSGPGAPKRQKSGPGARSVAKMPVPAKKKSINKGSGKPGKPGKPAKPHSLLGLF